MLNKAAIIGRIGKKDYKQIKNGSYMTTLSIATHRKFVDSQANKREETTWHTVTFFNKIADIANKYAHTGDIIYIEGEINHRKVLGKDNIERWVYSIVGSELKLLPQSRKKDNSEARNTQPENPKYPENNNDVPPFPEDMIPF